MKSFLDQYYTNKQWFASDSFSDFVSMYIFHRCILSRCAPDEYETIKVFVRNQKGGYGRNTESSYSNLSIDGNYIRANTSYQGIRLLGNTSGYALIDWDDTYSFIILLEESRTLRLIKTELETSIVLRDHPVNLSHVFIIHKDVRNEACTVLRLIQCHYYLNRLRGKETKTYGSLFNQVWCCMKSRDICDNWFKVLCLKYALLVELKNVYTNRLEYRASGDPQERETIHEIIEKDFENLHQMSVEIVSYARKQMNSWSYVRKACEYMIPLFIRFDIPFSIKPVYKTIVYSSIYSKALTETELRIAARLYAQVCCRV